MNLANKINVVLLFFLISGCNYYFPEAKKLSEKYGISLEEAQRCYLKFGDDTETVLDWVEVNKSWFFGFFSENCDDLIAQLPPFISYDNLLAAKTNKWTVEDPEYKNFLLKRAKEKDKEEKAKRSKEFQEKVDRMNSGLLVKAEQFGERWPFTVSQGSLACIGGSAIFRSQMTEYGLNGAAHSNGYNPIDTIWLDNPQIPGAKINIGEMIQLACPN